MPLPIRVGERRGAPRGASIELSRRRAATTPLDSRRLADPLLAAAAGPESWHGSGQEPVVLALRMENHRQHAEKPGAPGDGRPARRRLAVGLVAAGHGRCGTGRPGHTAAPPAVLPARLSAQAPRRAALQAPAGSRAVGHAATDAGSAPARHAALRGEPRRRCHHPHARADVHHASPPAGMANRGRYRSHVGGRSSRLHPRDDREPADSRAHRRTSHRGRSARHDRGRVALAGGMVALAARRLVDQSAAAAAGRRALHP